MPSEITQQKGADAGHNEIETAGTHRAFHAMILQLSRESVNKSFVYLSLIFPAGAPM
jgi:hypothetical protein